LGAWAFHRTTLMSLLSSLLRAALLLACLSLPPAGAWADQGQRIPPIASLGSTASTLLGAPALPVVLDDHETQIDAWPAVRVLLDPTRKLSLDDVLQRPAAFGVPTGPKSNLGVRQEAVWLKIPLTVRGAGRWVLAFDYPPLNRLDVYLLVDGRLRSHHRLGSDQPFEQRPVHSRAHALALELPPAEPAELLVRVLSASSIMLPITFHRADRFLAHETRGQILQGLQFGVSLALLVYSLVNGLSLRQPLFAQYALMLVGVAIFLLTYTGIGQQHLWSENTGVWALLSPMGVLLALSAGSLFVSSALQTQIAHPYVTLGLRTMSVVSGLLLVGALVGLLDYWTVKSAATILGPLPMVLALHVAVAGARRGDRASKVMLLGWSAYFVGALSMAGLLLGLLPVNVWTLHLFQITTQIEMLAWVRVLGLRIEGVQRDAERAELERHALHSLAYTDSLTGLPNRRGLHEALASALGHSRPEQALALYLLDLDGFKAVNDRLGHDAGDSLLVQVAHRLRGVVRNGDVVARLGGDEFVVMSPGMRNEADAQALGRKLLDTVATPFDVSGQRCSVGLTVGLALAPHDGNDPVSLLKCADAAMYAGKQSGRHCLRRATVSQALVPG
jgi:diguanylate cyclase